MSHSDESSPLINATGLAEALRAFADARDWAQFHSPKNLVMALTGEAGELAEIFQWMTEAESGAACADPKLARAVREEIADVLFYLVRLADVLGVDLDAAAREKISLNATKYPVERSRGNSRKYSASQG